MGFLLRYHSQKGPHFALRGESRGFPRGLAGSLAFLSNCDGNLKVPLLLPQGSLVSFRVVTGLSGFLTSHCRGNKPNANLCPETPCSSQWQQGSRGCVQGSPGASALSRVEGKNSSLLSSCDGYLLEPFELPKGNEASYGVLRGNSGLLSEKKGLISP